MQRIIDFVAGKVTYERFEEMFSEDPSIWDVAQTLLTPDIMENDNHPFWSESNRNRLESNNYSIRYACLSFGFDVYGKVVTHRMLGELVSYKYPDVILRDPPSFSEEDLRDKLGMEYLGGVEVDGLIHEALERKTEDVSVTKFIAFAKQELRRIFHLRPRIYPRWVQEAEWPMGKNSPMMFVKQNREGERVDYIFVDVDTEEKKTVTQYY